MKIVGIDLSGPRNFAETCLGQTERIVIGIDAPLSYNHKGGDRPSDAELHRLVRGQGGRVGIMPPTLFRMVYLTLRGVLVTRLLESLKPQQTLEITEVHPGAVMFLRGADAGDVSKFKVDPSARGRLVTWLETKGLNGISDADVVSDH